MYFLKNFAQFVRITTRQVAPWFVLSFCLVLLTIFIRTELPIGVMNSSSAQVSAAIQKEESSVNNGWWQKISGQISGVWNETDQLAQSIFGLDRLPAVNHQSVAQLVVDNQIVLDEADLSLPRPPTGTTESLQINVPLSLTRSLSVEDMSTLSSTTIAGPLTVNGVGSMDNLVVSGRTQLNQLQVSTLLTADTITTNTLEVNNFVGGQSTIADLLVTDEARLAGLLTATAGIITNGADIDAGSGNVFAANIVNQVVGGDNITVTGTRNEPIISFVLDDADLVTSLNGETGELELEGGSGIQLSGLTIRSVDTLSLVRDRGSCASCITDSDVSSFLTIAGGSINNTNIGGSNPATGSFTTLTSATTTINKVLNVNALATSTFAGSVNLTAGCFAINGTCIDGSNISYTGLLDTPATLLPESVPFVNTDGDALVQSSNFIFDGQRLVVGSSTTSTTLIVGGAATIGSVLTVNGTATSTFAGGINITGGCFAINGTCLDVGTNSYVGLSDTPSSLISGAIQFANSIGSGVTQSSALVFDGTQLGIGTQTPLTELSVAGSASVLGAGEMRWYDDLNNNFVAFRASSSLPGSVTWTLPVADGASNQLLVTDGTGNLRFESVSAIGGGANTYLDLADTVSSYATSSIPFVNVAGTALSQASNFVYRDNRLGVGLSTPTETLTVAGSVRIQSGGGQVGMRYNDGTNQFGFGTADPTERVTVQGGSFLQRGGVASDRYTPNVKSSLPLITQANDIAVVGGYAFVVTGQSGNDFHVIDIRNPLAPVEITSAAIPLPAGATAIEIAGRYAYVTTEVSGDDFHVIDINDPLNPVELSSVGLPTTANSVALQGQYAFVGTDNIGNDFHVIDISDPLNPYEVMGAALGIDDSVNSIAVAGQYAYLVSDIQTNDFHVIDISDPLNPVEVGWLGLPTTANDVVVVGRYAYVATNSDGNDFHVIDVSNPTTPVEVGSLDLDASALSVIVAGRYAYVTSEFVDNDVHVIDISNPTTPVEIGAVDLLSGAVRGIDLIGRYAYVVSGTTGNQFHIIDVSGAELQSADIHALDTGLLNVRGSALVGGNITASLGIRAGIEGIQTDGLLSVLSTDTSYIAGALSIGTTTSNTQLTVDGTIQAANLYGGSVGLETDANGNIIRAGSDERLKTNVTTIDGALESVMQLRGVRYQWRDTERFGAQTEVGFLAQEVDLILPEVVRKGGEYWSLNTRNIVAVVVEAIKELRVIVQGNQTELNTLRERVEQLENDLENQTAGSDNSSVEIAAVDTEENKSSTATDIPGDDIENASSTAVSESDIATSSEVVIATTTDSVLIHNQDSDTVVASTTPDSEIVVVEDGEDVPESVENVTMATSTTAITNVTDEKTDKTDTQSDTVITTSTTSSESADYPHH